MNPEDMDKPLTEITPSDFNIIPGTWGHKKFKLKNKFGQLNDDDLFFAEGKEGELIARLHARLNMTELEVQRMITAL